MKNGTRNVGTRLKGSRVIACIEAPCGLIKRAVVPRLTATTKSAMPRVEALTANLLPRDGETSPRYRFLTMAAILFLVAILGLLLAGRAQAHAADYGGKPIFSLKTAWKAAIRRAGIRHIRFHYLRHTFNTRLLELGVPREVRMALLGHTTKKDLTSVGSYGLMALWGIILASVANAFIHSTGLGMLLSYASGRVAAGARFQRRAEGVGADRGRD